MEFEINDHVVITRGEEYKVPLNTGPFVYMMGMDDQSLNNTPESETRYGTYYDGKVYHVVSVAPGLAAIKCIAVSNPEEIDELGSVMSINTTKVEAMVVDKRYYKPIRDWNNAIRMEKEREIINSQMRQGKNSGKSLHGIPLVMTNLAPPE